MQEKTKELWKKCFRRDNLIILILSGVLLFIVALPVRNTKSAGNQADSAVWPGGSGSRNVSEKEDAGESAKADEEDYAARMEEKLTGILSAMEGVGRTKVMVTLSASEELVVEKDSPVSRSNTSETDSNGGTRVITQVENGDSTVFHSEGAGSSPYVIKTISPCVEGVLVVAEGAGKGTVNRAITEIIQALFGVEAHKVKVVPMGRQDVIY